MAVGERNERNQIFCRCARSCDLRQRIQLLTKRSKRSLLHLPQFLKRRVGLDPLIENLALAVDERRCTLELVAFRDRVRWRNGLDLWLVTSLLFGIIARMHGRGWESPNSSRWAG